MHPLRLRPGQRPHPLRRTPTRHPAPPGSTQQLPLPKVSRRHAPDKTLILQNLSKDRAMAPMKKRMGRPSRGPRDVFTVKLTLGDGERLRQIADLQDLSYQDLLETI